jgi:hypothetical protein
MLQLLTTDEFAEWFESLDDEAAEDVATAVEVIERMGPERAAPGSRELVLWYEHPSAARFESSVLAWDLEDWGAFRDYTNRVLEQFESRRFVARLESLAERDAAKVLEVVAQIKRVADPRLRWSLRALGMASYGLAHPAPTRARPQSGAAPRPTVGQANDPCAELRRLYLAALGLAGFEVVDVAAHSLALRELATRLPAPGFRLLYGVNVATGVALVVLGEALDRSYYGASVRRAERAWKQFLDGDLRVAEPAPVRR